MMKNIFEEIKRAIEERTTRSAWSKGVTAYALELLESIQEGVDGGYYHVDDLKSSVLVEKMALNGASDWDQFSWGGCSLIYDCDIAERLCCPSELKKTRNGERRPNGREEWLDTQARALRQACKRLKIATKKVIEA